MSLQLLELHDSYDWQLLQVPPPLPQAEERLPVMHVLFLQQPLQLEGEQPGALHMPLWQVCPPEQVVHNMPPVPQAALVLPG